MRAWWPARVLRVGVPQLKGLGEGQSAILDRHDNRVRERSRRPVVGSTAQNVKL